MKGILAALAAEGYTPRYRAGRAPEADAISLAGPPPTLAEQYVGRMRERAAELKALFGPAGVGYDVLCVASDVHIPYTDAMQHLRGNGHLVFHDRSYVLDADDIDLGRLQPETLTPEEIAALEAHIRAHPAEIENRATEREP